MMAKTIMEVKSPKNPPEIITDQTPKEPFISPLQKYINNYCEKCEFWKAKCRLDDTSGIMRMNLCITVAPTFALLRDPKEVIEEIQRQMRE